MYNFKFHFSMRIIGGECFFSPEEERTIIRIFLNYLEETEYIPYESDGYEFRRDLPFLIAAVNAVG